MKTLIDQLGISHSFETAPKRIISLVPSQTELLYDLGQEAKIVGITKFCVHPYHFKSTKKVMILVTQTGQILDNSSTISFVFSSLLAMIKSGCSNLIFSKCTFLVPPITFLVDLK